MKLLAIFHSRYLIPASISNLLNFKTGLGVFKEAGIIAPTCHIPHNIFDSATFWQNISNGHNFQSHEKRLVYSNKGDHSTQSHGVDFQLH